MVTGHSFTSRTCPHLSDAPSRTLPANGSLNTADAAPGAPNDDGVSSSWPPPPKRQVRVPPPPNIKSTRRFGFPFFREAPILFLPRKLSGISHASHATVSAPRREGRHIACSAADNQLSMHSRMIPPFPRLGLPRDTSYPGRAGCKRSAGCTAVDSWVG